jgi:hypothetical protein
LTALAGETVGQIGRGHQAAGATECLAKFSCGLKPIGERFGEGALRDGFAPRRQIVAMLAERRWQFSDLLMQQACRRVGLEWKRPVSRR